MHHVLGAISFIALLHHPLLLAVQKLPQTQLALSYLIPSSNIAYNFGIAALGLMIFLLILTLFVQLPYHIWKNTHTWMGGVLLLASAHIFLIPSDVSRFIPLQFWIFSWLSIGLVSFLYKHFLYNAYQDSYKYKISLIQDMGEYVQLELEPNTTKQMAYQSGQFLFLSIHNKNISKESHPFSIASAPNEKQITLYCKKLGDYTNKLATLTKGSTVTIHGPYGTFLETVPIQNSIVCIAGGIGITPFLSLIKNQQLENKKITVFHVVRKKQTIFPPKNSLPHLQTVLHESSAQGRFSVDTLKNNIDNLTNKTFYMCGTIEMMESLRSQLLKQGVRPSKIIFEDFLFKS